MPELYRIARVLSSAELLQHLARVELRREIERRRRTAETAEEWAEVCRLEAVLNGGPWFGRACP